MLIRKGLTVNGNLKNICVYPYIYIKHLSGFSYSFHFSAEITLIYSSHLSLFKRDGLNGFLLILVSGSSVVYFCGLSWVMSSVPTSSRVL